MGPPRTGRFSQIVIYDSQYVPPEDAPASREVTDEEYKNLEVAGYTPQVSADNGFMFQRADQAMVSDTFSGPAYVSDNPQRGECGRGAQPPLCGICPWRYQQLAYPRRGADPDRHQWHRISPDRRAAGGGALSGDVALCPPGEKHWHGGSADTSFAHIAVNTNPELTGLEWFDRLSAEEYAQSGGPARRIKQHEDG